MPSICKLKAYISPITGNIFILDTEYKLFDLNLLMNTNQGIIDDFFARKLRSLLKERYVRTEPSNILVDL